jgi:hypothetical protein
MFSMNEKVDIFVEDNKITLKIIKLSFVELMSIFLNLLIHKKVIFINPIFKKYKANQA